MSALRLLVVTALVMVGIRTPDTPESFPPGVTALTAVPHGTVMAMWQRALFGVFPSKWPEPLATVVHEAMSNGLPVIGTTPGGHEDMIDDGETWPTKSWSSQRGTARAAACAAGTSTSPGAVTMPRRLPFARRCRARARVSTPAIAGMPWPRSSEASWRTSSATAAVAFATTSARSHGRTDWSSSATRP